MRDLFDPESVDDAHEAARMALEQLRHSRTIAEVDKAATDTFPLVRELEAAGDGLLRARAIHIRMMARYRRMQIRGQIADPALHADRT
jgi:hypothetical protein